MPGSASPGDADGVPLLEFAAVMRRLRAECPWKAAQTHRSLARYLLEETHEALEAIDALGEADPAAADHLREELGDLLLQVFFHAAIAEETGTFTLDDVARGITEKMVRRNPHVFAAPVPAPGQEPAAALDAAAVNDAWQEIKAQERSSPSQTAGPTEGLPPTLPALLYADKVLDRLERAGSPVAVDPDGAVGDRLLALVAEARAAGVDPEQALRDTVRALTD